MTDAEARREELPWTLFLREEVSVNINPILCLRK